MPVVLWFPGPASATGEDVAEFHVHGGRAVRDLHHEAAEGPEHEAPEWQAAMQALILVATSGGPTMLARIGMMRALSRHQQQRTKPAAEGNQKA